MKTELCEYFLKYFSDKCPDIAHSYSPHYYELFKDLKYTYENILEIGIGNNELMKPLYGEKYVVGGSLKALRDFFENAKIYGLDIREDVLFTEERIECFYTDQSSSEELHKTINKIKNNTNKDDLTFDLIIDDGSHIVDHMKLSFEVLANSYLKVGGLYIIEDIKFHELPIFINLETNEFVIKKIHGGTFEWDSFVVFQKI